MQLTMNPLKKLIMCKLVIMHVVDRVGFKNIESA